MELFSGSLRYQKNLPPAEKLPWSGMFRKFYTRKYGVFNHVMINLKESVCQTSTKNNILFTNLVFKAWYFKCSWKFFYP